MEQLLVWQRAPVVNELIDKDPYFSTVHWFNDSTQG